MDPDINNFIAPPNQTGPLSANRKIIFISGGVVLVFAIILLSLNKYSLSKFRIASTTPSTGNVNQISPDIKFNFNRQLSKFYLKVTSTSTVIKSYSVSGDTLDVLLNTPMSDSKTYTITINTISDTKGEQLVNKSISFKPKYVSFQSLTQTQQKAILKKQQTYKPSPTAANPILAQLPYDNLYFNISPSYVAGANGQSQLVLDADLILNASQMSDENSSIAQDKQQVQSWIQSLGLNPANYDIQYTITTP